MFKNIIFSEDYHEFDDLVSNLSLCTGLKLKYKELGCFTVSGPGYGKYLALVFDGKTPVDFTEIKKELQLIFEGDTYQPKNSTVSIFLSRMDELKLWNRF